MGNQQQAGVGSKLTGVSRRLVDLVDSGKVWTEMHNDQRCTRFVRMNSASVMQNTYDPLTHFEVHLLPTIPTGFNLIFLFPVLDNPDTHGRILYSTRYNTLDALNKAINERITRDTTQTQMAVCWMDHIYKITAMRGKIYLVWAREILVRVAGEKTIDRTGDVPLIVNSDGEFSVLSAYPLICGDAERRVQFLDPRRVEWGKDRYWPFLSCDRRPPPPIKAVSAVRALTESEMKVRRESRLIPDNELQKYNGTDTLEYYNRCNDDDSFMSSGTDIDSDILEFFAGGSDGAMREEARSIENNMRADASADYEYDSDAPSDGVRYATPLSSPARRTRIPVNLVAQGEHRTAVSRVRLVKNRRSRRHPQTRSVQSTSSGEVSPHLPSPRVTPARPEQVAPLVLESKMKETII